MNLPVSGAAPSAENRAPMKSTGKKGTGFSSYIVTPKKYQALAPEVRIFTSIRPLSFLFAATLALLLTTPFQAQTSTPPEQPNPPAGKVIFSRSTDENGQTTQTGPVTTPPQVKMADAPTAEDADRQAVTFTAFDLDVHLRPAEHHIAVRAFVTVRNDGAKPLAHIPLQISSTLNWERIRLLARDVTFQVATLNSDEDHTGQLHEAAVPLPQPLPPGGSIQLDVTYSGAIPPNAQRL